MVLVREGADSSAQRGFTLIELSVVLAILSAVVGMSVASGYSIVSSARLAATNKKMAAIDQALLAYRVANDRIPCPSDLLQAVGSATYGTEYTACATTALGTNGMFTTNNVGGTAFQVAEGGVPTVALGLPNDFMYDGWGNKFRYAVDVNMTYAGSFSATQAGALCGGIMVYAPGTTYDAKTNGTYRSGGNGTTANLGYAGVAGYAGAIYALVSHGPNGHGAVSPNGAMSVSNSNNADEQTNCHCSSAGVYSTYTAKYVQSTPYTYNAYSKADSSYNFDDIVSFKERWQMQVPGDVPGTACPGIWVTDAGANKRIHMFDLRGNALLYYTYANYKTPSGVRIDKYSNMWVVSQLQYAVYQMSASGSYQLGIGCGYQSVSSGGCSGVGTYGYAPGAFGGNGTYGPNRMAIDNSGNIWVDDQMNNRIQEFSSTGLFQMQIPPLNSSACPGTAIPACTAAVATGQFNNPDGLVIDQGNYLWVVDTLNNRVQKFDQYGNFIMSIPPASSCTNSSAPACTASSANGSFNYPKGIAIDAGGNIWVSEDSNNRIQKFAYDGTYLDKITFAGGSALRGVTVDPIGYIWTVESSTKVIYRCTPVGTASGGTCTSYGTSGSGLGQFAAPQDITSPPAR